MSVASGIFLAVSLAVGGYFVINGGTSETETPLPDPLTEQGSTVDPDTTDDPDSTLAHEMIVPEGRLGIETTPLPSTEDPENITDEDDVAYARRLTREIGVASIPISVFCEKPPPGRKLRFCFAKDDQILEEAASRLCQL